MSDKIKHECGLAFVRLLKPLEYYREKYGTALYGINKLQLLLQKQRNRGQDGAGIATIKLDMPAGHRYISRRRSNSTNYLRDVFEGVFEHFNDVPANLAQDSEWLKHNKPYTGELLLGHLRYGTHGDNSIETVHPFLRQSNWMSRNLVLAGNFNMTNVDELFAELVDLGQAPKEQSDTVTVLEKLGHFLDDEVERLFQWFKPDGHSNVEINQLIHEHLDIQRLLKRACKRLDGGYAICGMIGHGDAFIMRDPSGIRPMHYYYDDEIVVAASERPPIQTAFNLKYHQIRELRRGHALIVKKDGRISESQFLSEKPRTSCSFERIYFSRGTDRDIYLERKKLGHHLSESVLEAIDYDLEHTVFSFVPNTAETSFMGLVEGVNMHLDQMKIKRLQSEENLSPTDLERIIKIKPRVEKLVVKDAKLRTFIADEVVRGDMVSHVYDVTYGIVNDHVDTLVLMDDSIVRGTTLRDSIISICLRLNPSRIIIVSSAPQIRYPDCYGIDMSRMGQFIAFQALIALLDENGKSYLIQEIYEKCKKELEREDGQYVNHVKDLYAEFTSREISKKIAELITPKDAQIDVDVIYQSVDGLHAACPHNSGDWYFTGNYPTEGGNRVVLRAFVNYVEKKNVRAY